MTRQQVKILLLLFVVTRCVYTAIGMWSYETFRDTAAEIHPKVCQGGSALARLWAHWDSGFYYSLADTGYPTLQEGTEKYYEKKFTSYGVFPVYPLVVRATASITGDIVLAGILVSNIALLISCYVLFLLLKLDYSEERAFGAAVLLLIFPFNFLLSAFLSESLYLCVLLAALYTARKSKTIFSGVFGAITAASRPPGFLAIIPLLLSFGRTLSGAARARAFFVVIILFPTLLILYQFHISGLTGDSFILLNTQKSWNRYFSWNFPLRLYTYATSSYARGFEAVICLLAVALAFYSVRLGKTKNGTSMPPEYVAYLGYSLALPLLTGSFLSFPRFTTTLFPLLLCTTWPPSSRKFQILAAGLFLLSCIFMSFWVHSTPYIV